MNQIEFHPYFNAREIVAFCNKHGIGITAYAPVGDGDRSKMRDDPLFPKLAAAHNASIGQVILRYALQTGADVVIPRSQTLSHQIENLELFDDSSAPGFLLNEWEVAAISSIHNYTKVYATDCQPWC